MMWIFSFGIWFSGVILKADCATRLSVKNNQYDNLLFAVAPHVPADNAQLLLENIKLMMSQASEVLHNAQTELIFGDVHILIPATWTNIDANLSSWETYEEADVRVSADSYLALDDTPYTQQPGGCGEPGKFIHLTPNFLLTLNESKYGPPGKVFIHEFAHLRYGVFDEYGRAGDKVHPLFFREANKAEISPNLCTNVETTEAFTTFDLATGKACIKTSEGLYDDNCRYRWKKSFLPTASLLSDVKIPSIFKFCTTINQTTATPAHNENVNTPHNTRCNKRSTWSVIEEHPDIKRKNKTLVLDVKQRQQSLKFHIVRPGSNTNFVLVADVSSSMARDRLGKLRLSARRWIHKDIPQDTKLAIVQFSQKAEVRSDFVALSDQASRALLVKKLPHLTHSATCIGCGLKMAQEMLEKNGGGHIILISDGRNSPEYLSITDVLPSIMKSGIRVITIALGKEADPEIEALADFTGGKAFFVPDHDTCDALGDAFRGSLTFQPYVKSENVLVKVFEQSFPGYGKNLTGLFHIDPTVGRNTELRIMNLLRGNSIQSSQLIDPSGHLINHEVIHENNSSSATILIASAAAGEWRFHMQLNHGQSYEFVVIVVTQMMTNASTPINTECWFSNDAKVAKASNATIRIHARVTKGECPIIGAKVQAYIETPYDSVEVLDLFDRGVNADTIADDGIYSRFFTNVTRTGRYSVKCQMSNEGLAKVQLGFMASYVADDTLYSDRGTPYRTLTDKFIRIQAAGSFQVDEAVEVHDSFPPCDVFDLSVRLIDKENLTVEIRWTAPGDDMDSGRVSYYEVQYSNATRENEISLTAEDVVRGSLDPLEAGQEQVVVVNLRRVQRDAAYFATIRSVDKAGKTGGSNTASFYVPPMPAPISDSAQDDLDISTLTVSVVGLIACISVAAFILRIRTKENYTQVEV